MLNKTQIQVIVDLTDELRARRYRTPQAQRRICIRDMERHIVISTETGDYHTAINRLYDLTAYTEETSRIIANGTPDVAEILRTLAHQIETRYMEEK